MSSTSGTISPAAASTFTGTGAIGPKGYGVYFNRPGSSPANVQPTENAFYSLTASAGVYGTQGGYANGVFDLHTNECFAWCNPQTDVGGTGVIYSTSSDRTYRGIKALYLQNQDAAATWMDAFSGTTRLFKMSRSGDNLAIYSIAGVDFNVPGTITHYSDSGTGVNYFGQMYNGSSGGSPNTNRYGIFIDKARGTKASPLSVEDGDRLETFVMRGYTSWPSSDFHVGSRIDTYADGTAGGILTSSIRFATSYVGTLTDVFKMNAYGGLEYGRGDTLTNLNTFGAPNGSLWYCTDCNTGTSPCTNGGTGAFAARLNGAFRCF